MSRVAVLAGLLFALSLSPVCAQQPDPTSERARGGTVALTDWPRSLDHLLPEMGTRAPYLLPEIDSLGLDYRYATTDTTSRWSFVLGWQPGARVLYEGAVLPRRDGPSGVRMVNVELQAEVVAGGRAIGNMIVAVDSMELRPLPSIYSFEVDVGHDRVFLDVPADEARRALREGVTLRNLVVERMGFSTPEAPRTSDRRGGEPDVRPQEPAPRRAPSVYRPRTSILVGWRIAPRPYYVDGDDEEEGRTARPRGASTGQATGEAGGRVGGEEDRESRSGEGAGDDDRTGRDAEASADGEGRSGAGTKTRSGGKDQDDDEEDDEVPDLGTPALVAAGAVALTAVVGGTVGLYGTGDTPLGLTAGYTHPKGGVQLQAAVNPEVLEDERDQRLTVKALGFYDVFGAPVQPALGLGVQVEALRDQETQPAVSVGLVGNLGRVVLYGGVDVVHQTPEVGLSYNFRYRSPEEKN